MTDNMSSNRLGRAYAYQALSGVLTLGFKFLAWINGLGVLVVILCSLGLVQADVSSSTLRLPLAAFTAGLAFCGLALLWFYLVQTSLLGQMISGQSRRSHWIPLFCAMVAYSLSLAAFVIGCWFTLGLSGLASQGGDYSQQSEEQGVAPLDQSGRASDDVEPGSGPQKVVFLSRRA